MPCPAWLKVTRKGLKPQIIRRRFYDAARAGPRAACSLIVLAILTTWRLSQVPCRTMLAQSTWGATNLRCMGSTLLLNCARTEAALRPRERRSRERRRCRRMRKGQSRNIRAPNKTRSVARCKSQRPSTRMIEFGFKTFALGKRQWVMKS